MRIKVCGITTPEDADGCIALGVDWLGLNFVPGSPRRIDLATAIAIGAAVHGRAELVGVFADESEAALEQVRVAVGLDRLQLHGDEPPELVRRLGPRAFKAVRIGDADDVAAAERYEGLLLVDAKVAGALGGTGRVVDFSLVAPLALARSIVLAGGLNPGNVAAAVRAVAPWGLDVASGVERAPGAKDLEAVRAFVAHARGATGT